jgi:hypothetical protein
MHAVFISVEFDDRDAAADELPGLVSMVRGMPGVVTGYWVDTDDNTGTSITVFESEDGANALADMARNSPPSNAVTTTSIKVGEVMAHT